jgi:hypothetical protein
MKGIYRGVEIEAKRELCLGGWDQVYWSAYRKSDGYGIADGFGGGTVRECYAGLKIHVDEFLDEYGGDADKHGEAMKDYALFIGGMNK